MTEPLTAKALLSQSKQITELVDGCLTKNTPKQLEEATLVVKSIKAYKKNVHEYWDELCEKAHSSWKATTSRRKAFLDPADKAESAIKLKISRYYEAERAQKAEEHRKRVEAEEKAAEDRRLADMKELEDAGALEEAEHIANQPLDVTPVAEPVETKVEGLSTSERWYAEVVDLPELLKFCAGEPRWCHLVAPVMKELNKLATAQKEMFDIPGVEAKKKIVTSVRS